jgi:hypothetical protein
MLNKTNWLMTWLTRWFCSSWLWLLAIMVCYSHPDDQYVPVSEMIKLDFSTSWASCGTTEGCTLDLFNKSTAVYVFLLLFINNWRERTMLMKKKYITILSQMQKYTFYTLNW